MVIGVPVPPLVCTASDLSVRSNRFCQVHDQQGIRAGSGMERKDRKRMKGK